MKLFLGADHGGYELKQSVFEYLKQRGFEIVDVGDQDFDKTDDFQVYAAKVVMAMKSEPTDSRGILICTGGQGMAMAANRFKGIRASVIWDEHEARESRHDNDSNVLALPARVVGHNKQLWQSIVDTWLSTQFSGLARYRRRNMALDDL